jgi:hypothetical protein
MSDSSEEINTLPKQEDLVGQGEYAPAIPRSEYAAQQTDPENNWKTPEFLLATEDERNERLYGSLDQEVLTGLEGLASGFSATGLTRLEAALAKKTNNKQFSEEAQRLRQQVNPWISGGGNLLGTGLLFAATDGLGAIGETGAARVGLGSELAAKTAAERAAKLGIESGLKGSELANSITAARNSALMNYTAAQRIGSTAIKFGIENAAYNSGEEVFKKIFHDPDSSMSSAIYNIGAKGFLTGAALGGLFGTGKELWALKYGRRLSPNIENLNNSVVEQENVGTEAAEKFKIEQDRIKAFDAVATDPNIPESAKKTKEPIDLTKPLSEQPKSYVENVGLKKNVNEIDAALQRLGAKPIEGLREADPEVGNSADTISKTKTVVGRKLAQEKIELQRKLTENAEELLKDKTNLTPYSIGKQLKQVTTEYWDNEAKYFEQKYNAEMPHYNAADLSSDAKGAATAEIAVNKLVKGSPEGPIAKEANRLITEISEIKNVSSLMDKISYINGEITTVQNTSGAAYNANRLKFLRDVKGILKNLRNKGIEESAVEVAGKEGKDVAEKMIATRNALDAQYAYSKLKFNKFMFNELGIDYHGNLRGMLEKFGKISNEDFAKHFLDTDNFDQVKFLVDNFPNAAKLSREYLLRKLYENSLESAQGKNYDFRLYKFLQQIKSDKISPEVLEVLFPNKSQVINDLKLIHGAFPGVFNTSNTAPSIFQVLTHLVTPTGAKENLEQLGEYVHAFLAKNIENLKTLKEVGGNDKAAEVGIMKLATKTDKTANPAAFKMMTDYFREIIKGDNLANKTIESLIRGAPIQAPKLIPSEEDKKKLDKKVKDLHGNIQQIINTSGEIEHYAPEHASAMVQTASSVISYLNGIRPQTIRLNPFDKDIEPSKQDQQNYDIALTIAQQPLTILKDIKDGTLTTQKLGHLQAMYPAAYDQLKSKLVKKLFDVHHEQLEIPYKTKMGLSLFLGQPLDTTMVPQSIMALQPKMAQAQQQAMMPMQQSAQGGGRQRGSMKNIGKLADQQLTPMQTRIMEKQSVKV